jgi:hypothetical protein
MDVKFEVQDLFDKIRPNAKVHETLEEAAEALNEIVAKQTRVSGVTENTGEASDATSDKSEDEREPMADDEIEEEEDKQEDLEVFPFGSFLI